MTSQAPRIVLFAGQRVDPQDQAGVFPAELADPVREELRAALDRIGPAIGYASATAGGDILFGEELAARGGALNIHLPCEVGDFVRQYVEPAGGDWCRRFHALCGRAASVNISCEERLLGDETLIRFNNQMLQGLARIHAEQLASKAHLLLLWSPGAPPEPGSPADFMDHWPELERLSLIDLDDLRERVLGVADPTSMQADIDSLGLDTGLSPRAIRAIMFADIATYTKMADEEVSLLFDFLAEVQHTVQDAAKPPILINSWGDALHAVAETAHDLADYAVALTKGVMAIDPQPLGLSSRPRFRIALHAGPVFVGMHPLTGRSMIYGHHVNRAARIEPVAVPGEIYASQHFVALLRAEMDDRIHQAAMTGEAYAPPYRFDYLGMMELPKQFGREAVYRLAEEGEGALKERRPAEDRPGRAELSLSVRNELSEIAVLAERIDAFCEENGLGADIAHAVNLSLDELLTNTISYGYEQGGRHVIDVDLGLHDGDLTVRISDDGRAFDPLDIAEPDVDAALDDRPVGGLGIYLVRQMMDAVTYRRHDDRNEVVLTKKARPGDQGSA